MKNVLRGLIRISSVVSVLLTLSLQSYDFPQFYRAAYFFGEPRLAKDKLTSIDISLAIGSTCKSRNCKGDTICLLDLYGPSNMRELGAGIPDKDPTDPADLALIYLARVPGRDGFGFLSYSGRFTLIETILSITQNIRDGFFFQLNVPFKRMSLRDLCSSDLSPKDDSCPNIKNPTWQMFLNQLHAILAKYQLYVGDWKDTDFGDISLLFGFTSNYQEIPILDYIDIDVKVGVLIPSGRERSINRVFDVPPGYDGHFGIPLQIDASIGAFEWFTLGLHGDFIPFFSKTKDIRMKTDYNQSGPIKLAHGCAIVKKGPLFDVGAYFKADHFTQGFSLLIGYSYNKKFKDELTPKDNCLFSQCIVNSDPMLHAWDMHTIHLLAEYDFAQDNQRFCPRFSFFYNWQIDGRNVFKNSIGGGSIGFDMAWDF